jgi:hypothetical protein
LRVTCTRCREERWPTSITEPYVCQRCREVLAGGNAVDPCPSDAQKAAQAAAGERLKAFRVGVPSRKPQIPAAAQIPQSEEPLRRACRRHRPVWRLICADCNPAAERDPDALPDNWRRVRPGVMKRDGRRCKHCGSRERLSVHHITPRPLGTHDPKNLVTLCDQCHDAVEQPAEGFRGSREGTPQ